MQNTGGSDPARYAIESVTNAARILLMLRESRELQVGRVATTLGVARSTAHRLLTTLQAQGLLAQRSARSAYTSGPALVELGAAVVGATDLRSLARPALERLALETGETAHLLVLRDTEVLFIDGVEGKHAIRAATRIGARELAHASAAGKVLLAHLPTEELRRRYPSARLAGGTDHAAKTRAALERELDATRERGYGLNDSESESDLIAVSAPVLDASGTPVGAISISGPASRMRSRQADFAAAVRAAAESFRA
jgi:DNA-binding IclR family transcriptional regulator